MSAYTFRTIQVAGEAAGYREIGEGPPVLLVPGLGLTSRPYERIARTLAGAGFHAIVPDPPGFGATPARHSGVDVAERAIWLLELGDALGIGRAAWIGHSIACLDLMLMAEEAPDRVAAMALVSPTGAPGTVRPLREALRFARTAVRESPRVLGTVAREYIGVSPIRWVGTWLRSFRVHPFDELPHVHAPTLIIRGDRDPVVPESYVDAMRRRIPAAVVLEIRGSAHGAIFDRQPTVAEALVDFCSAIARDRPWPPAQRARTPA